jgi:hypothetical protein
LIIEKKGFTTALYGLTPFTSAVSAQIPQISLNTLFMSDRASALNEWPETFDDEGFAAFGDMPANSSDGFEDLLEVLDPEERHALGEALVKVMLNSLRAQLNLLRQIELGIRNANQSPSVD